MAAYSVQRAGHEREAHRFCTDLRKRLRSRPDGPRHFSRLFMPKAMYLISLHGQSRQQSPIGILAMPWISLSKIDRLGYCADQSEMRL